MFGTGERASDVFQFFDTVADSVVDELAIVAGTRSGYLYQSVLSVPLVGIGAVIGDPASTR